MNEKTKTTLLKKENKKLPAPDPSKKIRIVLKKKVSPSAEKKEEKEAQASVETGAKPSTRPTSKPASQKITISKSMTKKKTVIGGGKKRPWEVKKAKKASEEKTPPKEKKFPVPPLITIPHSLTVAELAKKMNLKVNMLIGQFMKMGMMITVNQQVDAETVEILAAEFNAKVRVLSDEEEPLIPAVEDSPESLQPRPPVVTVMGHVDHGKTTMLDVIRDANVAESEHGAITQHIGAYQVQTSHGVLTFIDTPGHEAFTRMRLRGAQVTDITVLVVAADSSVMPQTVEAIRHSQNAKVPIIVAITKVDLPDLNMEKIKQQLSEYDIIPEDWGGNTLFVEVSAKERRGIDDLLHALSLQAELMELKANPDTRAEGVVLESTIDVGLGRLSTVLITRGTLQTGDSFVAGAHAGKVRAILNDQGKKISKASPSMPVQVLGIASIPDAGDLFQVTPNERIARQIAQKRKGISQQRAEKIRKVPVNLETLYENMEERDQKTLNVLLKADTHGSVEALADSIRKIEEEKVSLKIIHSSAGAINEADIMLAAASDAMIIGFHTRPTAKLQKLATAEQVPIYKFNIIYEAIEYLQAALKGLIDPEKKEAVIGTVEIREVFKISKIGQVAGCHVSEGKITNNSSVRVFRDGIEVHNGKISSLKRFKNDAKEVTTGYECGIMIDRFNDIRVGDVLEVYMMQITS